MGEGQVTSSAKVFTLEELSQELQQVRKGKTVVHCHGVFDLLHPGHFKHFEAAKAFGDLLVVTVTDDAHVNKGPDRPVFQENLRAETIASLESVDYVAVNHAETAIPAIRMIQPDLYVKGQDYKKQEDDVTGGILEEENAVEEYGGRLVHTEEIQFSSSKLINRHLSSVNEEADAFLKEFRERSSYDALLERFDRISKLNVLVVGDLILDEYRFVSALGKASKSATITAKMLDRELYAGGALAVANHVADFAGSVTFLSAHGPNEGEDHSEFIKDHLHSNVHFEGAYTPDRPTTLKRRFVDNTFKHKLFEAIEIEDAPLEGKAKQVFHDHLDRVEEQYDLVLVADFGHGLMDRESVEKICNKNTFLAVNTQTNSANKGFNLLTKYPRLDYFSIDRDEAELALHEKHAPPEWALRELIRRTEAQAGSITLGVDGSLSMDRNGEKAYAPILTSEVVDTIGAGDAFLSLSSLFARDAASMEELAFVGNASGAMAVKILGNKSYIEKTSLLKYLKTLLS